MASATYESILRDVEQLSDDEQQKLLELLERRTSTNQAAAHHSQIADTVHTPLTPAESDALHAWFARADQLAEQVSAAWIDPSMSAVDAVREQRREL